jgi:predicted transcriptional regulator
VSQDDRGPVGPEHLLDLTSEIVVAYINKNSTAPSDISGMIRKIHGTLAELLHASESVLELAPQRMAPQGTVVASDTITPDYIICLEDGKRLKTLKRYLNGRFGLTPEQYRAKWNLPSDYPMVAPNYAAKRSELAKEIGLGRKRKSRSRNKRK